MHRAMKTSVPTRSFTRPPERGFDASIHDIDGLCKALCTHARGYYIPCALVSVGIISYMHGTHCMHAECGALRTCCIVASM